MAGTCTHVYHFPLETAVPALPRDLLGLLKVPATQSQLPLAWHFPLSSEHH